MLEHEDVFAEEAQEEARLSETLHIDSSDDTEFHIRDVEGAENETSPLMSPRLDRPKPTAYTRARSSYERAINEPWMGAHGSSALPWYKSPSVCSCSTTFTRSTLLMVLDLLAPPCLLPFLPGLWRHHRPQDLSHPQPDMQRLPIRSSLAEPQLQVPAYCPRRRESTV